MQKRNSGLLYNIFSLHSEIFWTSYQSGYIHIEPLRQPKLLNKSEEFLKKKNDKIGTGNKKMKKSESVILTGSHKNVIKLHSYNNVNQIINFIDNSRKKSQSKLYKKHFTNIQMTKSMDFNLLKMLKKNQIKC